MFRVSIITKMKLKTLIIYSCLTLAFVVHFAESVSQEQAKKDVEAFKSEIFSRIKAVIQNITFPDIKKKNVSFLKCVETVKCIFKVNNPLNIPMPKDCPDKLASCWLAKNPCLTDSSHSLLVATCISYLDGVKTLLDYKNKYLLSKKPWTPRQIESFAKFKCCASQYLEFYYGVSLLEQTAQLQECRETCVAKK